MHTSYNNDLIVDNSVEEAVRETPQICATCLTVHNRELFRVCGQGFKDSAHGCKKLVTKTGSLSLIPSVGSFQRPRRQQAGRTVVSPKVRADLLQDLVPRNTLRS
jgi:hypothetical protein